MSRETAYVTQVFLFCLTSSPEDRVRGAGAANSRRDDSRTIAVMLVPGIGPGDVELGIAGMDGGVGITS